MKKLLALAALGPFAFALSACGGGAQNETVVNETTVINADEGSAFGNDTLTDPGLDNQTLAGNAADVVADNSAVEAPANAH
ncbi:hypothetical protein E5A73_09510 [Sphingomonas gei]|uniref:Circumsporozoite protein n=1 Tax=Sphingomonas gei TaxID=1395960 RepID=A0A4S1XE25_9SPHN|nr:hypothetical protein [Sphingomonas gei]TGX54331.1 hypothetical protein E5A73_09510 [Sphingomonas gei]